MFILKNRYKLSDEELIRLVSKQQDHKAFEIIYDRYHQRVFTYFLRIVQDRAKAEDLLQELFASLWEKAHQFDTNYSFRPWFYTMGSNLMRKHFRQSKLVDLEGNPIEEIENETPISLIIEEEKIEEIRKMNAQLPEHLREVFWLRIIEEFSVKEVAKILQIPEGTVKSRLSKSIGLIRNYMTQKENYNGRNQNLG